MTRVSRHDRAGSTAAASFPAPASLALETCRASRLEAALLNLDRLQANPATNSVVKAAFFECFDAVVADVSGPGLPPLCAPPAHSARDGLHKVSPGALFDLLEQAARRLTCPDFGLRLAALECSRQDDNPFFVAMQSAETLGEALRWAAGRSSSLGGSHVLSYQCPQNTPWTTLEFKLVRPPSRRVAQTVEYALATLYHRIMSLSLGRARCEIRVSHPPLGPMSLYRQRLSCLIRFNQPVDAILVDREDLSSPLESRNRVLFDLASFYMDRTYAAHGECVTRDAENAAVRLASQGHCTLERLAAELGLQPRTLQRRLKAEGVRFFDLKDAAQQRLALNYLGDPTIPINTLARRLGYASSPAFTRSCRRWFSASPRMVRHSLRADNEEARSDPQPVAYW